MTLTYRQWHKTRQDIVENFKPITSFQRGAFYLAAKLGRWYSRDARNHRDKLEREGKPWDEEAFLDSEVVEDAPVQPQRPIVLLQYWGKDGLFVEPAYFIGFGYRDWIRDLKGLYVYARVDGLELTRTMKDKSKAV